MTRAPQDDRREPSRDLPGRIVHAAAPELAALRARSVRRVRRGVLTVAALLLAVPLLQQLRRPSVPSPHVVVAADPDVRDAAAWLATRLLPDGGFDPQSWSGPRAEDVAIHGLALLALARGDAGVAHGEELLRGAAWLLERQAPDGGFGERWVGPGRSGFGQPVATLALLEVGRITGDESVRAAARRAAQALADERRGHAAWPPAGPDSAGASPERAAWCALALSEAERQLGLGSPPAFARAPADVGSDLIPAGDPNRSGLPTLSRLALGLPTHGQPTGGFGPLYTASITILGAVPMASETAH
jgi:hypothetical protein